MTEPFADDNPVTQQGETAPFVIRLSRTASGSRTYTVGASLGRDETPEGVVAALFEIERLVAAGMEQKPTKPTVVKERDNTIAQLRRSVLLEVLKGSVDGWGGEGWVTTAEIVTALGSGNHRSQVVNDLKVLVADGLVEYQRGKGGNYPSTYRLAVKQPKSKAQKGKVSK